MKKIAVVTGASSGMGKGFVETLPKEFPEVEEIWAIARRADRLEALKESVSIPVRAISLDLSAQDSFLTYREMLATEMPEVKVLVNAAGYGFFCEVADKTTEENLNMVDLDCKALLAMCEESLPYMKEGGKILNIASLASFQPIPYIGVYGACKAFVLSFSRALAWELKKKGITVTALCPYWTKTEFFDRAIDKNKNQVVKKYAAMYEAKDMVERGWRDLKKGREMSFYGFVSKGQVLLVKMIPNRWAIKIWMKQNNLK